MDLASLQLDHSLDIRPDQRLSPADSSFGVASIFAPGQHVSGVPDKSIGQRGCKVNWFDDTDCTGSDSESIDDHDATNGQQKLEPETDDDDGSWQVVTRRQSRRNRKKPVAPGGRCGDARAKKSACEQSASAGQLPETSSADSGVTWQNQGPQLCRNDSISLSSVTSCWYWPICINSFARLSKVNWNPFHDAMERFHLCSQTRIKRDDFLHFQHMMTEGPQAIRRTGDVLFLVGPFKVLMSEDAWSFDTLLLSLVFERTVPGFLTMLGHRFVNSLTAVYHKHHKFRAITGLLIQICHEDEDWLNRLGWQKLSLRSRCNLFSSLTLLFKQSNEKDLIRNLHQQVSGSWLEKHYYTKVQTISCDTVCRDQEGHLRDLLASVRALFSWLEVQVFSVGKREERPGLIVRHADICDALLLAMDRFALPPKALLFRLCRAAAQWSVRFRVHLSQYLGFDRAISLLDKLLNKIDRWADLNPLAFLLRLSLLESVLKKCEELTFRRNAALFSQAWNEYEKKLKLLLAECRRFMNDYQPPFAADDEAHYARLKEETRLSLMLKESVFYRLDCEICRSSRQCIQENLQVCRIAFKDGWALDQNYREVGTIELAKWYFLAGKYDAGVSTLTNACFKDVNLSEKKAQLLARHGDYHSAVAELHHTKALMGESGETDQRKRDQVDNHIAMTQLRWYRAGDGTNHLIEAYRLSVDLLGRCDVRDRENFEGVLSHIVNAMKHSGLRFENFAGQTSVLGYLVKEGSHIKSWFHLANLLYIRHKLSLTNASSANKMADEMGMKHGYLPGLKKIS